MPIPTDITDMPTGYSARRPTHDDIPAILAIISACDVDEAGRPDELDIEDIENDWKRTDPAQNAYIICGPNNDIVATGVVFREGDVRANLDVYIQPDQRGRGLGTWLTHTLELRAREMLASVAETDLTLRTAINSPNRYAVELLEHEGYAPVRHFWQMRIVMDNPPPAPIWPEGLAVRACVRDEDERTVFDTLEEAFEDHWGHIARDYDTWHDVNVTCESYDPSLWFLALAGDEVAGAIRGRMRGEMGWVNTLGVRRPWRKSGLGAALLLQAFGTFYARGVRAVGLGVDAQNPSGATRLYERAGMRIDRQFTVYEKKLRPDMVDRRGGRE